MKIPKKVKVAGHEYRVLQGVEFDGDEDQIGECVPNEEMILIADKDKKGANVSQGMKESVFFHELLHAIDLSYNFGSLKEAEVDRLSEGIYQVLKDMGVLKNF